MPANLPLPLSENVSPAKNNSLALGKSMSDFIESISSGQYVKFTSPMSSERVPSVISDIRSNVETSFVELKARVHIGAERHVVLNGGQAVRELRSAAILGVRRWLLDDDVDISSDDAPVGAEVLVRELTTMRVHVGRASSSSGSARAAHV